MAQPVYCDRIHPQESRDAFYSEVNINRMYNQGNLGCCFGHPPILGHHIMRRRVYKFNRRQPGVPSRPYLFDTCRHPNFEGASVFGGNMLAAYRCLQVHGATTTQKYPLRFYPDSYEVNGEIRESAAWSGPAPLPHEREYIIEDVRYAVHPGSAACDIVPNLDEALQYGPQGIQCFVPDADGFDEDNGNVTFVNRRFGSDIREDHLSRTPPSDDPEAEQHCMLVLAKYKFDVDNDTGRWGPAIKAHHFPEDYYVLYNSWDTPNQGFIFVPVSEMANIVRWATRVVYME